MATTWQFQLSSPAAWSAMLGALAGAEQSIELEQFILVPDELGIKFLSLCEAKARAGLRVRLLCDAGGSWTLFRSSWPAKLRQAGVEIVPFNSFVPGSIYNHRWWFFRDHQKLLIIDGQEAFTGGICLAEEMRTWRDTHLAIRGAVVSEMRLVFERMWSRAHKRRYRGRLESRAVDEFRYLVNYPFPRQRQLYWNIVSALKEAKKQIMITTPYFVPSHRLVRLLKQAVRRGVRTQILIPERSDHPLVDRAGRTYFEPLLKAGVEIFLYSERMLHAKTIVVDESWATVGSFNFDHLSAYYNFEANLVGTTGDFVRSLAQQFVADLSLSQPVDYETWRRRSYLAQLLELLIYPLRGFI